MQNRNQSTLATLAPLAPLSSLAPVALLDCKAVKSYLWVRRIGDGDNGDKGKIIHGGRTTTLINRHTGEVLAGFVGDLTRGEAWLQWLRKIEWELEGEKNSS